MIKQPRYSNLCGQCCLATILDISLDESIKLVGHTNGTYPKELARHFNSSSLVLKRGFPKEYSLCKVHYQKKKHTHWVLYKDMEVYDPNVGEWLPLEVWKDSFSHVVPRITSHIEIL